MTCCSERKEPKSQSPSLVSAHRAQEVWKPMEYALDREDMEETGCRKPKWAAGWTSSGISSTCISETVQRQFRELVLLCLGQAHLAQYTTVLNCSHSYLVILVFCWEDHAGTERNTITQVGSDPTQRALSDTFKIC